MHDHALATQNDNDNLLPRCWFAQTKLFTIGLTLKDINDLSYVLLYIIPEKIIILNHPCKYVVRIYHEECLNIIYMISYAPLPVPSQSTKKNNKSYPVWRCKKMFVLNL